MDERPQWIAPRRYGYGYGAGFPISWQGWLLLGGYIAIVVAGGMLLEGSRLAQGAIVIPATVLLVIACARTTRGGWRWRWGEKD